MELYVEKEFMDNFCIEFNYDDPSPGQKIVASIFEDYGDIEWFMDVEMNTPEDFEELEMNYYFFAKRSNYKAPQGVTSIKERLFEHSNFEQTLIFTATKENWFEEAEAKGALCFSYENYEKNILGIINNCHYKIDLSEPFMSWEIFNSLKCLPFNRIIINDNYILTDKTNQPMDQNLIVLLRTLLINKSGSTALDIFTKNLNPISDTKNHNKEAAKKRYNKLNRELANNKKSIKIINNNLQKGKFDLHDRVLISNFLSIDSGKGFNLFPYKKSNSQIIVETIFDKYTYKRIRNHINIYNAYLKKIENLQTIHFTVYPS